jgi:hypothetical protein
MRVNGGIILALFNAEPVINQLTDAPAPKTNAKITSDDDQGH